MKKRKEEEFSDIRESVEESELSEYHMSQTQREKYLERKDKGEDYVEEDEDYSEEEERRITKKRGLEERRRRAELIKLRRELEAKQSGAGAWGREALEEDSKRIFLPDTLLNTVKTLQAFTLIDVLYITFLCGYRPTTARHNVLTPISTDDRVLFLFYFFPTFLHLLSIAVAISKISKVKVIFMVVFGAISLAWHALNLVFYFTLPSDDMDDSPTVNCPLYWVEMVVCFILLNSQIMLLMKVNYVRFTSDFEEREEEIEPEKKSERKAEKKSPKKKSPKKGRDEDRMDSQNEEFARIEKDKLPAEEMNTSALPMLPGEVKEGKGLEGSKREKKEKKKTGRIKEMNKSSYSDSSNQESGIKSKSRGDGTIYSNYSYSSGGGGESNSGMQSQSAFTGYGGTKYSKYSKYSHDNKSALSGISEKSQESEFPRHNNHKHKHQ